MEPNRNDYPGNSHKDKEEIPDDRPRKKKVITGTAMERKKPLSRRIAETFTGDDAQTVGNYILFDIVIPAAKSMMSDAVSQGVERMLFGTSTPSSRRSSYSYGGRGQGNAYASRYRQQREDPRDRRQAEDRRADPDDFRSGIIILETRTDAEVLVENMKEAIGIYQSVSQADVDDFLGVTNDDWMRRQWGWVDLDTVSIRRHRSGDYIIELPTPVKL